MGHVNYLIGRVVAALGIAMLLPLICSLVYKEKEFAAFAAAVPICLLAGGLLLVCCRKYRGETLRRRDSLLFATLVWVSMALFGSLPYVFAGCFPDYATCFFESMSGFTTTGASAAQSVDGLPHGILLWRSLSHWLGGAGVVLIFVMLLQRRDDSGEGMAVYNAEDYLVFTASGEKRFSVLETNEMLIELLEYWGNETRSAMQGLVDKAILPIYVIGSSVVKTHGFTEILSGKTGQQVFGAYPDFSGWCAPEEYLHCAMFEKY